MSAVLGFWGGGCTESSDGTAPAPSADVVQSRPGIVQVGDEDGPVVGEAETCERFREGVVRNRERLGCDLPDLLACPELVRPLASLACATYSEASLDACLDGFDDANDCDRLLPGACVLTAVLFILDPDCASDASSSTGGGSSTSGSSGDGGSGAPDGATDVTGAADGGIATGDTRRGDSGVETVTDAAAQSQAPTDAGSSTTPLPGTSGDGGEIDASNTASPTDGG